MSKVLLLVLLMLYFGALMVVSYFTGRKANNQTFFSANKSAPWYLVAFGMIGTSLSGVTFISVPGTVGGSGFAYFQVAIGYFLGYFVVAFVLLPLYYRLNLTSIYNYLEQRFGIASYKTGAVFFIISRTMGATLRLYLVINVLQIFIIDQLLENMNIPFWLTATLILTMILLYTFKGGVKTIVWTDTLQTFFMLLALVVCVYYIMTDLGLGFSGTMKAAGEEGYSSIFFMEPLEKKFFLKQIIGGAFITIAMTGLDQEMMQKNISVKSLHDAKKNMVSYSAVMVVVNFLFLLLGALLFLYAGKHGLTAKGDDLFPTIALQHLPGWVSIIFIIGLISALFPSADGAITALTASFCIDILGIQKDKLTSEAIQLKRRKRVHLAFAGIFLMCVLFFKWLNDKSIIDILLELANYTYGPLLGLFAFGILTKRKVFDHLTPLICIVAPVLSYLLNTFSVSWMGGYKFGFELLIVNGALTFLGLWASSFFQKKYRAEEQSIIEV
ncbi:MAG: sodium:solute symporter [Crocinitomicaceae bacterium]|nr:sodium:solute symporter [Crocinitomicaceae bacterium]